MAYSNRPAKPGKGDALTGKGKTIEVPCPKCGHQQPEPVTAISTNCRACGQYFRVQEALKPVPKPSAPALEQRLVTCFECRIEQPVALSAQSTMCRKCSAHIDLNDYRITSAVSKNFRTHGSFVLEPRGYLFNSETVAGEALLKGRFLGKLTVERALTIFSGAEIKGTFQAHHLVIPAGNTFRWAEPIQVDSAEIAGELIASVQARKRILLQATGHIFGDVTARDLVVAAGAVFVGKACVR
jgi:cytoskeletal protein CcmA (bactofilin family)